MEGKGDFPCSDVINYSTTTNYNTTTIQTQCIPTSEPLPSPHVLPAVVRPSGELWLREAITGRLLPQPSQGMLLLLQVGVTSIYA